MDIKIGFLLGMFITMILFIVFEKILDRKRYYLISYHYGFGGGFGFGNIFFRTIGSHLDIRGAEKRINKLTKSDNAVIISINKIKKSQFVDKII